MTRLLVVFSVAEPWPLEFIILPLFVGALAVYLLLPRPTPFPRLPAALAAAASIVMAGVFLVQTGSVSVENVLFYTFSGIAILAGGLMITQHHPAYAALSFALVVLATCGLFLLQAAPFLMASTVIIYAGAIIVTFLFVLMLAQREGPSDADDRSREPLLATIAGFVLLGALLAVLRLTYETPPKLAKILNDSLTQVREAEQKAQEANPQTPQEYATVINAMVKTMGTQFFDGLVSELNNYEDEVGEGHVSPDLKAYRLIVDDEIAREWNSGRGRGGADGLARMRRALTRLEVETNRLHALTGSQPPDPQLSLSGFSGPPPNAPLRWNAAGDAPLPADNVGALGRSLFTDYLLAVELGGTLLLVATIGAIIIALRGGERRS